MTLQLFHFARFKVTGILLNSLNRQTKRFSLLLQAQKAAKTLIGRNFGLLKGLEKEMCQNALRKTSFLTSIVCRGGRHLKFPIKFSMLTQQTQSKPTFLVFIVCIYAVRSFRAVGFETKDLRSKSSDPRLVPEVFF